MERVARDEFDAQWAECLADDGEPWHVYGEHLVGTDASYLDSIAYGDHG